MEYLCTVMTNTVIIRDARPEDAPFLAKCIMAGMHFYDFETPTPVQSEIYEGLVECVGRDDTLYTYRNTRIAEAGGISVGILLSYPGEIYKEVRDKTFRRYWPAFFAEHSGDDLETGPGEYYLDSLAVIPSFRGQGIGSTLLRDGIQKGSALGYRRIALVADSDLPQLVHLYESVGFRPEGHRRAFGVDFQRMVFDVR